MRLTATVIGCLVAASLAVEAQRSSPAARAAATKLSTAATCAADLGTGVKSRRRFCDVVIGPPADSVLMRIPAHTGTARLLFDLHNRFTVPAAAEPGQAFASQSAVVAVVRTGGQVIDRAAVVSEFRTVEDLFDRIVGTGPGGVKNVAPGLQLQSAQVTIPAGVTAIGIVGVRLDVVTREGTARFDTTGRPVAIVSNMRIEYTAAR